MREVTVAMGGIALFVMGLILVGSALSVLIYSGAMSAILLGIAGEEFLGVIGMHAALLIVGAVMAFAGMGVFVAAFNLRRSEPRAGR